MKGSRRFARDTPHQTTAAGSPLQKHHQSFSCPPRRQPTSSARQRHTRATLCGRHTAGQSAVLWPSSHARSRPDAAEPRQRALQAPTRKQGARPPPTCSRCFGWKKSPGDGPSTSACCRPPHPLSRGQNQRQERFPAPDAQAEFWILAQACPTTPLVKAPASGSKSGDSSSPTSARAAA